MSFGSTEAIMTANHLMAAQIVEGMTVKDDDQKPSSELTRAAVRAFTLQVRSDLGLAEHRTWKPVRTALTTKAERTTKTGSASGMRSQ